MKIIWFSEIKWQYLKTRKQQILSRFPNTDEIYFIEPLSSYLNNNFTFKSDRHIRFISIPQFQVPINNFLSFLTNNIVFFYFMRFITKIYIFFIRIDPDVVVISNVYWYWVLRKYRGLNKKIIYDCNDNPLAFPKTKKFKKKFFIKTLKVSHRIIIPSQSYKKFIPKEFHKKIISISNGVDYDMFLKKPKELPANTIRNSKPVIMYIGAIDNWFDINLIKETAKKLPNHQIVLIGPASRSMKEKLTSFKKNILYIPTIPHSEIPSYLSKASVCIIPFIKNDLTNCIMPNKIFEYSAAGKKTILTNFNPDLKEFDNEIDIAINNQDFIKKIVKNCNELPEKKRLVEFSKKYDWKNKSEEFRKVLSNFLF
mgnify:CR=1 FL=1